MKRIFLIALLIVPSIIGVSQQLWTDTLELGRITGDDTVIWYGGLQSDTVNRPKANFPVWGEDWAFDVQFDTLGADDATVDLGGDLPGLGWSPYIHDSLPMTLDSSMYVNSVNGVRRVQKSVYGTYWPYYTFGIKVNPGSITDTTRRIIWHFKLPR